MVTDPMHYYWHLGSICPSSKRGPLSLPACPDNEQRPRSIRRLSRSPPFSRLQVLEEVTDAASAADLVSLCA